jgi:hypothetical protein
MQLLSSEYDVVSRLSVDAVYWLIANLVLLSLRTMSNQFGDQASVVTNRDEAEEEEEEEEDGAG